MLVQTAYEKRAAEKQLHALEHEEQLDEFLLNSLSIVGDTSDTSTAAAAVSQKAPVTPTKMNAIGGNISSSGGGRSSSRAKSRGRSRPGGPSRPSSQESAELAAKVLGLQSTMAGLSFRSPELRRLAESACLRVQGEVQERRRERKRLADRCTQVSFAVSLYVV